MPPHGRVGCCRGITALRVHACTQDAKAHNRYATNYIRLPSVSKQFPLPLSFLKFLLLHSYIQQLLVVDMELKKLPNQIRKKSWQSEWTFLLPPICNRISDVSFTQHFRTSSSLPWAQYHVIVFPLIYGFQGNLSTLRHCNIQREYQNLNKNPFPFFLPPPALPRQQMTLGFLNPRPEPAAVLDRQTDSSKSKGPSRTVPRAPARSQTHRTFFPDKLQTLPAKQKRPCLLRLPSIATR